MPTILLVPKTQCLPPHLISQRLQSGDKGKAITNKAKRVLLKRQAFLDQYVRNVHRFTACVSGWAWCVAHLPIFVSVR